MSVTTVTTINLIVLGLILTKIALFAQVARRFRTPERAAESIRRITRRLRSFQCSVAALLLGLIVLAEGDAVRLHAGLDSQSLLFRTTVLVGYALLTAGLVAVTLILSWEAAPPAARRPPRGEAPRRGAELTLGGEGKKKRRRGAGGVAPWSARGGPQLSGAAGRAVAQAGAGRPPAAHPA